MIGRYTSSVPPLNKNPEALAKWVQEELGQISRVLAGDLPKFTVAQLNSITSPKFEIAYVSNGTGNKRLAVWDKAGSVWRFPDGALVT